MGDGGIISLLLGGRGYVRWEGSGVLFLRAIDHRCRKTELSTIELACCSVPLELAGRNVANSGST
jgi:hypothetical protein